MLETPRAEAKPPRPKSSLSGDGASSGDAALLAVESPNGEEASGFWPNPPNDVLPSVDGVDDGFAPKADCPDEAPKVVPNALFPNRLGVVAAGLLSLDSAGLAV